MNNSVDDLINYHVFLINHRVSRKKINDEVADSAKYLPELMKRVAEITWFLVFRQRIPWTQNRRSLRRGISGVARLFY